MGFLTEHVATVRRRLAAAPLPHTALEAAAATAPAVRPFGEALRSAAAADGVAVIAEVKRASPSAGAIAAGDDPVARARAYADGGAATISVLTEPEHFGGSLEDLHAVRAAVDRPVLRKDFLVHPDQVLEARAAGADAVLVIVAALDDDELASVLGAARAAGIEPLVETHSDRDLDRALATDARVVGVNARDLESLAVDPAAALGRLRRIDPGRIAVLESGVRTHDDVRAAVDAGASAILVGETLMRAADPAVTLQTLIHGKERTP
jgi:indole-3-glycerol phosphate synthase